ncbi:MULTISPECIES: MOSC N-terminal beta barrel domain-containing protein [unclassified Halomonas]|uniref:MOSC domain-containing protein n=1 Tax=unclassified Halomonas TaxID=2609666 RepID=UPI0007D992B1|nr:MOSC N-terminal beta barrel domain-containing protein [Halomonas sp. ALS9]MBT2785363.1 MOSC N-terminal beta barrel domain-containing protein [Halomonas sp. ISL-106]MBT2799384.1 MOSC N-terminal beta barrel domain-containing protein [Halomonas sp. ISL-104]OAL59685.1 molybdenum cofactor sulfurase [Halomonas sp. ALS9]
MEITQLNIYPVKSLQGISVNHSKLQEHGLAWDRRWMLVDAQQRFVTQRQLPALATVEVALTDEYLVLSHSNVAPLNVPLAEPEGNLRLVSVWNDQCKALPESEEVSRWLLAALGEQAQGLSMVRFANEFTRAVEEDFLDGGSAHTYFSDGYPFLITTTGSLDALNQALIAKGQAPIPMNRFRPNIVVKSDEAWAEDRWATLTEASGTFQLALRKPCKRCKITTIDQHTAAVPAPAEPLKTLIELNTQPTQKGAHFGQNATLLKGANSVINVGDKLSVTARSV